MVSDYDVVLGGHRAATWRHLWMACHEGGLAGPVLREWPDGGALLNQSALLVQIFQLIEEQMSAEAKSREQQRS